MVIGLLQPERDTHLIPKNPYVETMIQNALNGQAGIVTNVRAMQHICWSTAGEVVMRALGVHKRNSELSQNVLLFIASYQTNNKLQLRIGPDNVKISYFGSHWICKIF